MPRPKPKKTLFEVAQERAEEQLLLDGAKELLQKKQSNNGQLPYGAVPEMLKRLGCPGITRHKLCTMFFILVCRFT